MRNTLIPIFIAICLFITGVTILNIQLWYSAKAEYLAGARYAANNINHILEEASQATQTAVNIAGKECDFFKQKTAYAISYCDWSSDVCSSDLYS